MVELSWKLELDLKQDLSIKDFIYGFTTATLAVSVRGDECPLTYCQVMITQSFSSGVAMFPSK